MNQGYTLPTIHLNGSGAENLHREYRSARRALSDAADTFLSATFHARDFYPVEGSWEDAREERAEIIRKFDEIYSYLIAWEEHCFSHIRK